MIFGDRILAICRLGLQKEETENEGIFCFELGGKYVCEFSNKRFVLEPSLVRRYFKISESELFTACEKELNLLVEALKKACSHLLKQDCSFEIDSGHIMISPFNLEICPSAVRVNSILGYKELPGWEVIQWNSLYSWEYGPDIDENAFGKAYGVGNVCQLVLNSIFKISMWNYFDSLVFQEELW